MQRKIVGRLGRSGRCPLEMKIPPIAALASPSHQDKRSAGQWWCIRNAESGHENPESREPISELVSSITSERKERVPIWDERDARRPASSPRLDRAAATLREERHSPRDVASRLPTGSYAPRAPRSVPERLPPARSPSQSGRPAMSEPVGIRELGVSFSLGKSCVPLCHSRISRGQNREAIARQNGKRYRSGTRSRGRDAMILHAWQKRIPRPRSSPSSI
jgi:hypothetical protein